MQNDSYYGSYDLEYQNWTSPSYWAKGDEAEVRVAGTLWDLCDTNNDGFDKYLTNTYPYIGDIWDTFYRPGETDNTDNTFEKFYNKWPSTSKAAFEACAYQNTIFYNDGRTLAEAVDTTLNPALVWSTGGDADGDGVEDGNVRWFGETYESCYLGDAAQSGYVARYGNSWIQLSVNGPGTLLFRWKINAHNQDHLDFYIDGVKQSYYIHDSTDWEPGQGSVTSSGIHTFRWQYNQVYTWQTSTGSQACGWLDKVQWIPNTPPQLSNGDVDPDSGSTATTFTYSVTYYDADGNSPTTKNAYIDGTAHPMALTSGTASNGVYGYIQKLAVGTHNYYFSFDDGNGASVRLPASGTFSGPTVSDLPPPPNITTLTLPDGTVGVAYLQTLEAKDGIGNYTWSISAGSLPAGLSLNSSTGIISGTPTTEGTFNFTAKVTDQESNSDTQDLSIIVNPPSTAVKLIGSDTPGNGQTSANRLILGKFQATETGTVDEIRVFSLVSGNVTAAIYSDNAGQPDARLGYNDTPTVVTEGQWNTIFIPSTSITAGTDYWLAAANDVKGALSFNTTHGSGTSKGKGITFSTFTFPSTLTDYSFTDYDYERAFAGWGTISSTTRLLGTTNQGTSNTGASRFILLRCQAQETGYLTDIKLFSSNAGNAKVALYADNAGTPGTLLAANNNDNPCSAGVWNTISITPTPVTKDAYYWIAAIANATGILRYDNSSGSGTSMGTTVDYAGFSFPDSIGVGFTNYSIDRAFDGWGTISSTTERLLGTTNQGTSNTSASRFILGRFQATETGTIDEIRVYSRVSGNVKVAIYSEALGQPDTLLNCNNTSTPVTAGQWNTISIPSTYVNSGIYYWLAAANDIAGSISYDSTSGSGTSKGKDITAYSTFTFPDTAGTDFTSYSYERAFAGWGEVATTWDLIPNAAGDSTTLHQYPDTGENWDKVDDPPGLPDDSSTYVNKGSQTGTTDYYNLTDPPDLLTEINSVTVHFRVLRSGTVDITARPYLRLNGVNKEGTAVYPPTSWTTYSQVLARPGGGSWTRDDLANLQVGISPGSNGFLAYGYCTQIYVTVDCTANGP